MTQLQKYRNKIDLIDTKIIELLAKRFSVTKKVGIYKATHGISSVDKARERLQMLRVGAIAKQHGLSPDVARSVIRKIIALAISNHRRIARKMKRASV